MFYVGVILLCTAAVTAAPADRFTRIAYTSDHDIVKIAVPVNKINENCGTNSTFKGIVYFFVEADIKANGEIDHKGLFVSTNNGTVKKLLDDGTDVTSARDDTNKAYFAAKDGIYVYNCENNSAEKYGTINDYIIGIANERKNPNTIYILTKEKKVYKVVDDGQKKIDTQLVNVDQIALDNADNLYYRVGKEIYVVNKDGSKKVEGVQTNRSYYALVKHISTEDEGILLILDKELYVIGPNGMAQKLHDLDRVPTAISLEAMLLNYIAYDKKIYEVNLAEAILTGIMEALVEKFKEWVGGV